MHVVKVKGSRERRGDLNLLIARQQRECPVCGNAVCGKRRLGCRAELCVERAFRAAHDSRFFEFAWVSFLLAFFACFLPPSSFDDVVVDAASLSCAAARGTFLDPLDAAVVFLPIAVPAVAALAAAEADGCSDTTGLLVLSVRCWG